MAAGRGRAAWSLGLAAWLGAHAAAAQDRGGAVEVTGAWDQMLREAGDGAGTEGHARPDDRDLVRSGVFARWAETIAVGATVRVDGVADLDGNGGLDRLLTVAPCADPYPFDEEPGMVLVRSAPGGFRATVLLRGGFNRGDLSWRLDEHRGRWFVTVVFNWGSGHSSEGFCTEEVRHRYRLARDGVLHAAGTCQLWWNSASVLPVPGPVVDDNGGRCW